VAKQIIDKRFRLEEERNGNSLVLSQVSQKWNLVKSRFIFQGVPLCSVFQKIYYLYMEGDFNGQYQEKKPPKKSQIWYKQTYIYHNFLIS
jgi:hypothetical protein